MAHTVVPGIQHLFGGTTALDDGPTDVFVPTTPSPMFNTIATITHMPGPRSRGTTIQWKEDKEVSP